MNVFAIDIGGSSIKYAKVNFASHFSVPQLDTVNREVLGCLDWTYLRQTVRTIVSRNVEGAAAIAISTSGSIDPTGIVISAGHFNGYAGVTWKDHLSALTDVPITVINDGRAAAWGEYCSRRPRASTHVHVVLGTGIGGGIVHNGELLVGDSGQAGYIGRIRISNGEGNHLSSMRPIEVEDRASELAMCHLYAKETGMTATSMPRTIGDLLKTGSSEPDALAHVLRLAGAGLGEGLGAVLNILNPGVITIGGGVAVALRETNSGSSDPADDFMSGVLHGMRESSHRRPFSAVECEWGTLGNNAGLIGAARVAATLLGEEAR